MKDVSIKLMQRHTIQIFIKQIREYKYDHYNDEILIPNIQTRLENAQMSLSSEPSLIAYTKDGI